MKAENPEDEKIIEELKEMVPITMLSPHQREVATYIGKKYPLEAVKYIHSITKDGLKTAKTYFDLYIDEHPHYDRPTN